MEDEDLEPPFEPIALRERHDGFTPLRQVAFLDALAESGCVDEACRSVGVSRSAAYALHNRIHAARFRLAWDAALDMGIQRLYGAALSRAINGVARPVFYQGKQVGEKRYYDERLTQFLLRARDPANFARSREQTHDLREDDVAATIYHVLRLDAEAAEEEDYVTMLDKQANQPNRRQRRATTARATKARTTKARARGS